VGSICQGPVKPAFNELGGCCPGEDNGQHGRQDRGADRGGAEHFVQADKGERQRDRDDQPGGGQQGPGGVAGPKGLRTTTQAEMTDSTHRGEVHFFLTSPHAPLSVFSAHRDQTKSTVENYSQANCW